MKSKYKEEANRRYYLHWKIRKQGFELQTEEKTIRYHPKKVITPQVLALSREYGYNLQTYIE